MPLSVALALVQHGERLLLIQRERGSYAGRWALPGGKIEDDEHVAGAVRREIQEEADLKTTFERHLGVVSEHLRVDGETQQHFLLHVCLLEAETASVTAGDEGELRWVNARDAAESMDRLVPSDRAMIQRLFLDGDTGYHECVLEKDGDTYHLCYFD